jgi:hypothetical protein
MIIKSLKIHIILILMITFTGCSVHYVPQPYPVGGDRVPPLKVKQAVDIINTQIDTKFKVPIGPDKYMKGNLREWTDTAVQVLKTELKKNDIAVSDGASKMLKLSVTRVNMFSGTWNTRCILYIKVETGDGYAKEFEGNNLSPEGFQIAGPFAVTNAVAAMLNNDKILGYLEK